MPPFLLQEIGDFDHINPVIEPKNFLRYLGLFQLGVLILILSIRIASADDSPVALYDQGKYQEALDLLQKTGLNNAKDYYNAGNCLFKLGKNGQALAYFEKALALAPGNADIRHNRDVAFSTISQSIALPKDQSFWTGFLVPFSKRVPEWLLYFLMSVVTIGFALYLLRNPRLQKPTLIKTISNPKLWGAVAVWLFVFGCFFATSMAQRTTMGVVLADAITSRSGPNESFTELFRLPAGTCFELTGEKRVNEKNESWVQMRFSLGNMGWVMEKDVLTL